MKSPLSEFIVDAIGFLFFILLLGAVSYAFAEPTHEAQGDGVKIVAHSEPCKLPAISNLPHRATWLENGKVTEGCFGVQMGLAIFYWADKTVVVVPANQFVRVTGA